ncbi:Kievitone hydratase [Colletotrichum higginsianum]|uniref:Kievitone hydratase n=1 Tax=Colletotrichum higginsianum TaxID=80884 RepID=A0A4T0VJ25_9PEZI|nr:Kievitone hydratase [Colletotrichum higginsianum]
MGRFSCRCFALVLGVTSAFRFDFVPERTSVATFHSNLPELYSLQESQLQSPEQNSYWTAAFVTATNNHQYAVMSQTFLSLSGQAQYQSAILDLEDTNNYWRTAGSSPLIGNATIKNGVLDIELEAFGFRGVSQDSVSTMNMWGEAETHALNITFNSSPVLLNAGVGRFLWGTGVTTQWSLPRCKTQGTFTINGTTLEIDPERSLTWYDRQHGFGGPSNFTWFGIVFSGGVKVSAWLSDTTGPFEQQLRFATVHAEDGLHLLRLKEEPGTRGPWTSPNTNLTYAQSWSLKFDNGDTLSIRTVREDQERLLAAPFYSGVVEVEGSFFGQQHGFGFVDIVTSPL